MPRLVGLLGRSWLIGSDDFVFICPGSALLHLSWAALEYSNCVRVGAWSYGVPDKLCEIAGRVCIVSTAWDCAIALYSARGTIMQQDRRRFILGFLRVRLFLSIVLVLVVALVSLIAALPTDTPKESPPLVGWELWWTPSVETCTILFVGVICSQFCFHGLAILFGLLISKDVVSCGSSGGVTDRSVRMVLRWFGANDSLIQDIVEALMRLLGDVDFVPSDLVFGLLLVGATQEKNQPTSPSEPHCPKIMSSDNCCDKQALHELQHFAHFAFGIYGCPIHMLRESVYEGTSIPVMKRLACACCHAIPCLQKTPTGASLHWCCCPPLGPVYGDNFCRTASYALRRSAANSTHNVELLRASWVSRGFGGAPPYAVFCDHTSCELIIAVRGSLNLQDCILDLACKPEPYDPLCFSQGGREQCEDGAEFFVHAGMLSCMRDLKRQFTENGVIEEALALGGKAHGYKVVCTGHSLGAGIAVLLALELRQTLRENVRYVGFEPPACLSPRLARETQDLGWYSVVCAQDWVPRLSLRNLQKLREDVMDELLLCPHSKVQLAMIFSTRLLASRWHCWQYLRRGTKFLLAAVLEPFAFARHRSDSDHDFDAEAPPVVDFGKESCATRETLSTLEIRRAQRQELGFFAEEQHCAGRLVVLRPVKSEPILCGWWSRDTAWVAAWGSPEQFMEMLVMHRALEYHFPHIIGSALAGAAHALNSMETATEPASLPVVSLGSDSSGGRDSV